MKKGGTRIARNFYNPGGSYLEEEGWGGVYGPLHHISYQGNPEILINRNYKFVGHKANILESSLNLVLRVGTKREDPGNEVGN